MQVCLKILSVMANSVDPNQTAPKEQSDLGLHCLHMPFCQTLCCTKFQNICLSHRFTPFVISLLISAICQILPAVVTLVLVTWRSFLYVCETNIGFVT